MNICFVTPHGEGALRARLGFTTKLPFGGAEQQIALLTSGLAERGHLVTLVCSRQPGLGDEERLGPVRILRIPLGASAGPGIQRRLRSAVERSGAGFVYQRCALPLTGRLAWLCRRSGRRFIFAVANDRDLDGRIRHSLGAARYWMYRYGLSRAHMVVIQTRAQESLLPPRPGRSVLLLPSALDLQGVDPRPEPAEGPVLWIGNLLAKKRPLELLRLARALPRNQFLAVGDESKDPDLARRFRAEAERLPNLVFLGRVDHAGVDALYRQASVLLNTSEAEGVPNTFLEAWARGVPVVSARVDPDGVIAREDLGLVIGPADAAQALTAYLQDRPRRALASARARTHVERHHRLEVIVERFESALAGLSGGA